MISLRSTAHVERSADEVWALFRNMQAHYLRWHSEHLAWRDLRGHVTETDGVVFADERVGWLRLRSRFVIDEAVRPRRIRFHLGFPWSLLHAGGSFEISPSARGCEVTAETHFGGKSRLGARLVDPLLRRVAPLAELERHMREEGENLGALASGGG